MSSPKGGPPIKKPRQDLPASLMRRPTPALILLCILTLSSQTQAQTTSSNQSDVASIEAYARTLEAFAKRNANRARIFGNIVSPNQEAYPVRHDAARHWEEYPTRKARESAPKGYDSYDGAEVWMRNGKLVVAEIQLDRTFVAASRRAVHYFRSDGTLAKTINQYFESDYYTIRETIHGNEGNVLQVRTRCFDTGGRSHKVVKCPDTLPSQIEDPVYRRVDELPFKSLLTREPSVGVGGADGSLSPPGAPTDYDSSGASSVDTKPVPLNAIFPRYTEDARANQIQGIVILRVHVGADGTVQGISVVRGLSHGLTEQAIAAARQTTFKPAMKDGKPVPYWLPVELEFIIR